MTRLIPDQRSLSDIDRALELTRPHLTNEFRPEDYERVLSDDEWADAHPIGPEPG